MEESVYWDIMRDKVEEKVRAEIGEEVKAEIEEKVKAESEIPWRLSEARRILVKLASKRFGASTPQTEARLSDVSSLEKLEAMVDRIFDVKSWDELLQAA